MGAASSISVFDADALALVAAICGPRALPTDDAFWERLGGFSGAPLSHVPPAAIYTAMRPLAEAMGAGRARACVRACVRACGV
jgi:hypothetical protein